MWSSTSSPLCNAVMESWSCGSYLAGEPDQLMNTVAKRGVLNEHLSAVTLFSCTCLVARNPFTHWSQLNTLDSSRRLWDSSQFTWFIRNRISSPKPWFRDIGKQLHCMRLRVNVLRSKRVFLPWRRNWWLSLDISSKVISLNQLWLP